MSELRPAFAAPLRRPRAISWHELDQIGLVAHDRYRGWHVQVQVLYPGARRKRKVRITWAAGLGKIETEAEARKVLQRIRAQCEFRPLHEVVSDYKAVEVTENLVPHRWEHDFLREWRRRWERGEISAHRLRELEAYPRRGYLEFWRLIPIHAVDEAACARWLVWLRETYPHLSPVSLRHVVRDFGTFLRWEELLGALVAPKLPNVRVPREPKAVPSTSDVERILAEIPERLRGLWMGRAYLGLRPAEARRVRVQHYREGVLEIPAELAKDGETRRLPVQLVVPELDEWIRKHRAGAGPFEPLFPSTKGGPWTYSVEWRQWARACEAAGVERCRPSWGGRHHFATMAAKRGVDLAALREWMGHADLATTRSYFGQWDVEDLALAFRVGRPSRSVRNAGGGEEQ